MIYFILFILVFICTYILLKLQKLEKDLSFIHETLKNKFNTSTNSIDQVLTATQHANQMLAVLCSLSVHDKKEEVASAKKFVSDEHKKALSEAQKERWKKKREQALSELSRGENLSS